MIESLGFLEPQHLVWLIGLAPLLYFLFWAGGLKLRRLRAFRANAKSSTHWLLPVILCAITIFALTRPYSGSEEIRVSRLGSDIMVVVDISKSMLATDVSPNRLEFAKRKLQDLISHVERNRNGDRLGIVLFSGESYLFCPLTSDYAVLRTFAREIADDLISIGGSGINSALQTALTSFRNAGAVKGIVLLLSDGEDSKKFVIEAVSNFREREIPIHVLGIGTDQGKPILLPGRKFVKDRAGDIVISRLHEPFLQEIASSTRGDYLRATLGDRDLRELLGTSSPTADGGQEAKGVIQIYHELGPLLLWVPLTLVFLAIALNRREVVFALLFFLWCFPPGSGPPGTNAHAAEPTTAEQIDPGEPRTQLPRSLYDAYQAYQRGDFQRAEQGFRRYWERNPGALDVLQSYASSLYKLGRYEEARRLFEQLDQKQSNLGDLTEKERFDALYNLGNTQLQMKDYERAIKSYEEALTVLPKEGRAEYNLELARRLMQKMEQQEQQQQSQQQNQQQQQNQEQSDQQESNSDGEGQGSQQGESNTDENDADSGSDNNRQQDSSTDSEEGQEPETSEQEQGENSSSYQPSEGDPFNKKPLEIQEAEAWLESLPDAPVLLQRRKSRRQNKQEQWW